MCDFGSSLPTFNDETPIYAHPSLGGHATNVEENGRDYSLSFSPSPPSSFIHTPHTSSTIHPLYTPITSPLQGIFSITIEMNRIQYCTRGRLLDNSDHAYFAELLATNYTNTHASLHPHIFANIDSKSDNICTFHSRSSNKFEVNTISMGLIKGKNLSQQFPSPIQRTKKTNFSTTVDNKVIKYTYVCIPDIENKWFEHRWKIESKNGGSYYLCIDVPGTGIKRKRNTQVTEKSKTQKIFHEVTLPSNPANDTNCFITWCPSTVSSPSPSPSPSPSITPSLSPSITPSLSSSASSFSSSFSTPSSPSFQSSNSTPISSPPSIVPSSPSTSVSPTCSPLVPMLYFTPSMVPDLTSVQELDSFLSFLCNN